MLFKFDNEYNKLPLNFPPGKNDLGVMYHDKMSKDFYLSIAYITV